jgi:protein gp37
MGKTTGIEWTNATWNPWQGCTKVSNGCRECYMYREKTHYGQNPFVVVRSQLKTFNAPLNWKLPDGSRIFVCSWSDFFHKDADELRPEAWRIIRKMKQYIFLIPTKRVERIRYFLPDDWGQGWDNVWIGASIEDQKTADERIKELWHIPAAKLFLSVEPMLENIRVFGFASSTWGKFPHKIGWCIVGSESGPNARLFDMAWARSLKNQCQSAGVPFFLKQATIDGKLVKMPKLDGKVWDEIPEA